MFFALPVMKTASIKSLPVLPVRRPTAKLRGLSEHLLKRLFKAEKPNEKWLTDVTELKGKDGKLYLSPILDLFNREIVAYAMSRRADSEMVKEMLEKAAPRLTAKGTMLHSDQGVLYRTAGYRELLAEHSMVQSMSRKANCWDNAPMESFFAVLKTECFYRAGELPVPHFCLAGSSERDDFLEGVNPRKSIQTIGFGAYSNRFIPPCNPIGS